MDKRKKQTGKNRSFQAHLIRVSWWLPSVSEKAAFKQRRAEHCSQCLQLPQVNLGFPGYTLPPPYFLLQVSKAYFLKGYCAFHWNQALNNGCDYGNKILLLKSEHKKLKFKL